MKNNTFKHAILYAKRGYAVLPIRPNSKVPATKHGVKDASADPRRVELWCLQFPRANLAMKVGKELIVLDIDPRHGGDLDAVIKALRLDLSQVPTQRSPRGGWHLVFSVAHLGDVQFNPHPFPGVDLLHGERYLMLAPSTVDGKAYTWERHILDCPPPPLPPHTLPFLLRTSPAAHTPLAAHTPHAARDTHAARAHVGVLGVSGVSAGVEGVQDAPDLSTIADALLFIKPWDGDYHWWVSMLMAIHSADPGPRGLALAVAWADGKPGEVEAKWASFRHNAGVTWRSLLHEAALRGWRPPRSQSHALTTHTHSLHTSIRRALVEYIKRSAQNEGSTCPTCGTFFVEHRLDSEFTESRRRFMLCHRPDCRISKRFLAYRFLSVHHFLDWEEAYMTELSHQDYKRLGEKGQVLRNNPNWFAIPRPNEKLAVFSNFPLAHHSIPMLPLAAARLAIDLYLAMPPNQRLRRHRSCKRTSSSQETDTKTNDTHDDDAEGVEGPHSQDAYTAPPKKRGKKDGWTPWPGLSRLSENELHEVFSIMVACGATVDLAKGYARWPRSLNATIDEAIKAWLAARKQRLVSLDATSTTSGEFAAMGGARTPLYFSSRHLEPLLPHPKPPEHT